MRNTDASPVLGACYAATTRNKARSMAAAIEVRDAFRGVRYTDLRTRRSRDADGVSTLTVEGERRVGPRRGDLIPTRPARPRTC